MKIKLNHKEYTDFLLSLMHNVTGKDFVDINLSSHYKKPRPDLMSTDRKICVEVGDMRPTPEEHHKNFRPRVRELLKEFEEVWWFQYPEVDEKFHITITQCFVFKRGAIL